MKFSKLLLVGSLVASISAVSASGSSSPKSSATSTPHTSASSSVDSLSGIADPSLQLLNDLKAANTITTESFLTEGVFWTKLEYILQHTYSYNQDGLNRLLDAFRAVAKSEGVPSEIVTDLNLKTVQESAKNLNEEYNALSLFKKPEDVIKKTEELKQKQQEARELQGKLDEIDQKISDAEKEKKGVKDKITNLENDWNAKKVGLETAKTDAENEYASAQSDAKNRYDKAMKEFYEKHKNDASIDQVSKVIEKCESRKKKDEQNLQNSTPDQKSSFEAKLEDTQKLLDNAYARLNSELAKIDGVPQLESIPEDLKQKKDRAVQAFNDAENAYNTDRSELGQQLDLIEKNLQQLNQDKLAFTTGGVTVDESELNALDTWTKSVRSSMRFDDQDQEILKLKGQLEDLTDEKEFLSAQLQTYVPFIDHQQAIEAKEESIREKDRLINELRLQLQNLVDDKANEPGPKNPTPQQTAPQQNAEDKLNNEQQQTTQTNQQSRPRLKIAPLPFNNKNKNTTPQ